MVGGSVSGQPNAPARRRLQTAAEIGRAWVRLKAIVSLERISSEAQIESGIMHDIFISYSHGDKSLVRRLVNDLRLAAVDVWIDEAEINIGEPFLTKIERGLDGARFVAVIMSARALGSQWVLREVRFAKQLLENGKITRILPVLIDDSDPIPELQDLNYIDMRPSYYDAFDRLISILDGITPAYITAKGAVSRIKSESNPPGNLWAISQKGINQTYLHPFSRHRWTWAQARLNRNGESRQWIAEFVDCETGVLYPYGWRDGEIVDYPTINGGESPPDGDLRSIDFSWMDSDLAFAISHREHCRRAVPRDEFCVSRLMYQDEYRRAAWRFNFFDPTLIDVIATYIVGANNGELIDIAKVPDLPSGSPKMVLSD
jgi:hypothetical protein